MLHTNTLYEAPVSTPLTGSANGTVVSTGGTDEYVIVQATVTSGTGTVVFEGRNSPLDGWVLLWQATTTDATPVMRMPQIRARVSGATLFVGRASISETSQFIS